MGTATLVLLFLNAVTLSSSVVLNTLCVTSNPFCDPLKDVCTYWSVVEGYDVNIERSYRRAARTRFLDHYTGYPILGNTSCNISIVSTRPNDLLKTFGFFNNTNMRQLAAAITGDEVKLGSGHTNQQERMDLTLGVFHCIFSKHNHTDTAAITIMKKTAVFRPLAFTITANLHENVTLEMIASEGVQGCDIRWRYSWNSVTKEMRNWTGNTSPVIDKVNTSDAGVYEAYTPSSNYSGYVRLIVRQCSDNLWGPPGCRSICPVCNNSGICDDISGECICPPGFTGGQCEQECPSGYIGQQCNVSCQTIRVSGDGACRGLVICLPDPFGCTCAPGFTGLDCQTECSTGNHGVGCSGIFHSNLSSQCNNRTGFLDGGPEPSRDGPTPMCQVLAAEPYNVTAIGNPIQGTTPSITVTWQVDFTYLQDNVTCYVESTGYAFLVYYQESGGGEEHNTSISKGQPETLAVIEGLKQCTEYSVSVSVKNDSGTETIRSQIVKTWTDSEDPTIEFSVTEIGNDTNSAQLEVTWTREVSVKDLKCDPRLGYEVFGTYREVDSNVSVTLETHNQSNNVTLQDLRMCTQYDVTVNVRNHVNRTSNSRKKRVMTDSLNVTVSPVNISASSITSSSITIHWQIPGSLDLDSLGCDPKRPYSLVISYGESNLISASKDLKQSYRSFTFKGLDPGVTYVFYVMVKNAAGRSGPPAKIECNTQLVDKEELNHKGWRLSFGVILAAALGGLLLALISLLCICLKCRKRGSTEETSVEDHRNSNEVMKLQPSNEYGKVGGSVHIDNGERYNCSDSPIVEVNTLTVDFHRKDLTSSTGRERKKSDGEVQDICIYENQKNDDVCPRHLMSTSDFIEFMRLPSARGKILSDLKTLHVLTPKSHIETASGSLPENLAKNRFPDIFPMDKFRTPLNSGSLSGGSDYVNACLVTIDNTYSNRVIMTQAPLPETVEDFWRLVFQYKCQTIIMLNEEIDNNKKVVKYWPDLNNTQFHSLAISCTFIERKETYTIHHFEVSNRLLKENSVLVKRFAYHDWPAKHGNFFALLRFMSEIGFGKKSNNPTLLHCIDGAGRSGIYATVTTEIKRIKTHQAIKLFDTLKEIRKQNPFAVNSQEDYLMCHRLLQFYINEMQAYDTCE